MNTSPTPVKPGKVRKLIEQYEILFAVNNIENATLKRNKKENSIVQRENIKENSIVQRENIKENFVVQRENIKENSIVQRENIKESSVVPIVQDIAVKDVKYKKKAGSVEDVTDKSDNVPVLRKLRHKRLKKKNRNVTYDWCDKENEHEFDDCDYFGQTIIHGLSKILLETYNYHLLEEHVCACYNYNVGKELSFGEDCTTQEEQEKCDYSLNSTVKLRNKTKPVDDISTNVQNKTSDCLDDSIIDDEGMKKRKKLNRYDSGVADMRFSCDSSNSLLDIINYDNQIKQSIVNDSEKLDKYEIVNNNEPDVQITRERQQSEADMRFSFDSSISSLDIVNYDNQIKQSIVNNLDKLDEDVNNEPEVKITRERQQSEADMRFSYGSSISSLDTVNYDNQFKQSIVNSTEKLDDDEIVNDKLEVKITMERQQSEGDELKTISKVDRIIQELIDTEKNYINTINSVIIDYKHYLEDIQIPSYLIGRDSYLFGNISIIYVKTSQFYNELINCQNWENVVKTFINYKSLFELYPIYSKNKPKADQYLQNEFKELLEKRHRELKHDFDLASYLIAPIQRLPKYIMLLENLKKELTKQFIISEELDQAINIVKKELIKGNDYIAIDSIKDLPENCQSELGSLVMREIFLIKNPKKYESTVFLFEELIVFTEPDGYEQFIYKSSVRMCDVSLNSVEKDPLVFHITDYRNNKRKKEVTYVLQAKGPKTKQIWIDWIRQKLFEQFEQCKEKNTYQDRIVKVPVKYFCEKKKGNKANYLRTSVFKSPQMPIFNMLP